MTLQQCKSVFYLQWIALIFTTTLNSVEIQRIPWPISSEYSELAPTLSRNGNILVFASNRPEGAGSYDLYESRWIAGKWSTPQPLDQINTRFFDGYPSLSPDGNTLYFSSNRHREDPRHEDLDIYVSQRLKNGHFGRPSPMSSWNSNRFDAGVSIALNNHKAWFASSRAGGKGGTDIYYSDYKNGKWLAPRPVPGAVNSEKNEFHPQVTLAGERMFFSSNRSGGEGGYDFYYASRINDNAAWRTPRPVPLGINDDEDQLYFHASTEKQLFYFNTGKKDEENIFVATANSLNLVAMVKISGRITEKNTGKPIANAPVSLLNLNPDVHHVGFRFPTRIEFRADDRGFFSAYMATDNRWVLAIDPPAFSNIRKVYDLSAAIKRDDIFENFQVEPRKDKLNAGAMFDVDSDKINEYLLAELDVRARELKFEKGEIFLFGYVDYRESRSKKNRGLGYRRAQAVRRHLLSRGIPDERIHIAGQGIAGDRQSIYNKKKLSRGRVVTIRVKPNES